MVTWPQGIRFYREVFGIFFFFDLPDRRAETLKEAIVRYIQPGSHIVYKITQSTTFTQK